MRDSFTVADATACANELRQAGGEHNHAAPNVKLALAYAIASGNNRLDRNGKQAQQLREYAMAHRGKLPVSSAVVTDVTGVTGFPVTPNQARGIAALQERERLGELVELNHMPTNGHEWLLWRQTVRQFYCLGWKTASFAALLAWPFDCPLVPVDRHVVARLAYAGKLSQYGMTGDQVYKTIGGSTDRAYRLYRQVERQVGNEKLLAGEQCSTALWHWAKWSSWRAFQGIEDGDTCESHRLLSPYWY